MSDTPRLTGLIAATYTPFHADGSLAPEHIAPLVDRLISDGISGLYVCGSTGEGMSLTSSEREQVVEASVDATARRVPVIVQVGHNSIAESRRLAAHAAKAGADAVSAVCPSYYPIGDLDTLIDCMADVAGAAPDKPFYFYHIPMLSKAAFDMVAFLEQAGDRIPTLAGIKYTAPTVFEFQACRDAVGGAYDLLWGLDEMLLAAWHVGARGGVGSTYNVAAPIYRRLLHACEQGDAATALECQRRSVEMIRVLNHFPFHPAMKALLEMLGHEVGPTRLPMRPMTDDQKIQLRRELTALGYFDWIAEDAAALEGVSV